MISNQEPPNSNERQRKERDALQRLWNLCHEKLCKLREALAIETDPGKKFQLQKQVEDAQKDVDDYRNQLEKIEQTSQQSEIRHSHNDETQQNLSNMDISEIDREIEQEKAKLREIDQAEAQPPKVEQGQAKLPKIQLETELRREKRPRISNPCSYFKALIIKVYTCKIIFIVIFVCGILVLHIFHIWPFNQQGCESPAADVSDIDFSPDGKYLATASLDKTVQVLKVTETRDQKNEIRACPRETEGVVAVKFSPNGKYLATASLDSASLWNVNDDGIITSKHKDLSHYKLQPNNDENYKKPVVAIDFSQDGNYLATVSADGEIKVWNMKNLKDVKVLPTPPRPQGQLKAYYIVSVSFSHNGNYIATTDVNDEANVWELKADGRSFTPQLLKKFDNVTDVAFSKKYLATASVDGTIRVWDVPDFQNSVASNLKHNTYVRDVSFSPNGKFIPAIGLDKKVSLWDRKTNKPAIPWLTKESLQNNTNVVAIAFSLDDKYLAVAHTDGKVRIWNTISKKEEQEHQLPEMKGLVTVAFSKTTNGEYLAMAGADGQIEIRKFEQK